MAFRIGCDVGGTFTDLGLVENTTGKAVFVKIPTTTNHQSVAVVEATRIALRSGDISPGEIAGYAHGTTVATNAILERKGAKTALLITTGFRDLPLIARQMRPHLYDARARRPAPLVPRHLTFEVPERTAFDGRVITPLDETAVQDIASRLAQQRVESVAVVLLHSPANPRHERRIGELLSARIPDVDISLSVDVLPEPGEYERASTTTMNAYIMPALRTYIDRLRHGLAESGITMPPVIMQSNGGVMTAETAGAAKSVHTCLSGPAAGLIGAARFAEAAGFRNAVTIDMGGTSFDVGLISEGEILRRFEGEIEGFPLRIPMFDIITLGAGGGSIAKVDVGGMLSVGPESAGARPGPAAYAKGGREPTVTDANVVLGRLRDGRELGGGIIMDRALAIEAIDRQVASRLGLSVEAAADGIRRVVNAAMVRGIRRMTVERGLDPREFALLAFGGAGPLHAVDLARELGMKTVIIPPSPGLLCAIGLLLAPWRHDATMSLGIRIADLGRQRLGAHLKTLHDQASDQARAEHVDPDRISFDATLDLRYQGQGHQLTIPLPGADTDAAVRTFHEVHARTYGYDRKTHDVEAVTLRLVASAPAPVTQLPRPEPETGEPMIGQTRIHDGGGTRRVPVFDRLRMVPGTEYQGPLLIEQEDSTLYVDEGTITVDATGNLIIRITS